MKKFNLLVVVAWFFMFTLSFHVGPAYQGELEEEHGIHYIVSSTIFKFNEMVWSNCGWCVEPSESVRIEVGTIASNAPIYEMHKSYASLTDNRLTVTILRNTFPSLLVFMGALNIAFYAGRGDFGKMRTRTQHSVAAWWHGVQFRRRQKRGGITLRNPDDECQISDISSG